VIVAPGDSPTLESNLATIKHSCILVDEKTSNKSFGQILGYNYAQHQNNNSSVSTLGTVYQVFLLIL